MQGVELTVEIDPSIPVHVHFLDHILDWNRQEKRLTFLIKFIFESVEKANIVYNILFVYPTLQACAYTRYRFCV